MDIEVLGSLSVRVAGRDVAPSAPKPRQVLALLALHADQMVPVGMLTEELWGARPPRSARTTLQTYVLQLRDRIGEALAKEGLGRQGAKDVLVTLPGGYRLETDGGSVDFHDFERQSGAGYRAMDAEDYRAAAQRLREALSLWSGAALADVQAGSQIGMEIDRLEEARLCALDQRIEADLRLGYHRKLLSELTFLASLHRTHESLHGQLMLALHRSGRRGEALGVYQRLRSTLVTELGLEPSPQLQRLQRLILKTQPEVPPASVPAGGAGVAAARSH